MKVVRTPEDLHRELDALRAGATSVGFVPTMGALHDGHLSLVALAAAACDVVAMSIFVNPLQFGPTEDLGAYPRDEASDLRRAESGGADLVFLPSVDVMYPPGASTTVHVGGVTEVLEGHHRPGHFDGVATVVLKLFNLVAPDVAFFGQKDAQQVAVVKRMVEDLDLPVAIEVGDTIRDPDGLALSSRNAYLSADERARALSLYRCLQAGRNALQAGESPAGAERSMSEVLAAADGVEPDYAAAVDPDSFGAPRDAAPVLLVVAASVGGTRLIDNLLVKPSDRGTP